MQRISIIFTYIIQIEYLRIFSNTIFTAVIPKNILCYIYHNQSVFTKQTLSLEKMKPPDDEIKDSFKAVKIILYQKYKIKNVFI